MSAYAISPGFKAGDKILFKAGETFTGAIWFKPNNPGSSANPIIVGSYVLNSSNAVQMITGSTDTRRATLQINDLTQSGMYLENVGGYDISHLFVRGPGIYSSQGDGIVAYNYLAGNVKLDFLNIHDLEVSDFGKGGISIGGGLGTSGYKNVWVTTVNAHDNLQVGIQTFGTQSTATSLGYANFNVNIENCRTHDNHGQANTASNSGSGILIGNAQTVVVQHNIANGNGDQNTHVGGPVGIWVYDSDSVIIQYNESHHNHTNSVADGGGFDIDGGVTNSFVQYNYSHDNDGAGILLAQYEGARPLKNNTVRYNISQNDGRKNGYGAIHFYGQMDNINVYNNTVFISKTAAQTQAPSAVLMTKPGTYTAADGSFYVVGPVSNVHILNNIFYTASGARLLSIGVGNSNLTFNGNRYYASDNAPFFGYGGGFSNGNNVYQNAPYTSLAAFKTATAQETNGLYGDPKLAGAGTGGDINDPYNLTSLNAYKLVDTTTNPSPIKNAGINLNTFTYTIGSTSYTINAGTRDYYGTTPIPAGTGFSMGAFDK